MNRWPRRGIGEWLSESVNQFNEYTEFIVSRVYSVHRPHGPHNQSTVRIRSAVRVDGPHFRNNPLSRSNTEPQQKGEERPLLTIFCSYKKKLHRQRVTTQNNVMCGYMLHWQDNNYNNNNNIIVIIIALFCSYSVIILALFCYHNKVNICMNIITYA